jgi:hypothetical protein
MGNNMGIKLIKEKQIRKCQPEQTRELQNVENKDNNMCQKCSFASNPNQQMEKMKLGISNKDECFKQIMLKSIRKEPTTFAPNPNPQQKLPTSFVLIASCLGPSTFCDGLFLWGIFRITFRRSICFHCVIIASSHTRGSFAFACLCFRRGRIQKFLPGGAWL